MQLLIVESDDDLADVLATGMADLVGAPTAVGSGGGAATEILRSRPIDLVVSETLLSDISGFELAKRAADRNVPLLLIPGHPDDQQTCRYCGYPHLDKPFGIAELARALPLVIRNTQQMIERIQRSHATLTTTLQRRAVIVNEARRLRSDSKQLQAEGAAARTQERSRASVSYGEGTLNSHCSLCRHFVQWRGDLTMRCQRVEGPISPRGWCKLFIRRR